jgi:succinate dehydrogenase/fumarate reductase flavoprotein subunit
MSELTRRDMLKIMGITGAAAVFPPGLRAARAVRPPIPTVNILKSKPHDDAEVVETDLVVIGTGLGGLWAAVTAADEGTKRIAVVDKGALGVSSGSSMILGGTFYWLDGDDLDACEKEYLSFNGGLGHIDMLRDMMQTCQRRWDKWKQWGVEYVGTFPFGSRTTSDGNTHNKLSLFPHYKEWSNGRAMIQCLLDRMDAQGAADYYSKTMITDLLTNNGRVVGAVGINRMNGKRIVFKAPAVILATGSCTFGPGFNVSAGQTGDGYALAYRAGNKLQNVEFLNPDVVARDYHIEGGHLTGKIGTRFINKDGKDFMWDYDPKLGTNSTFNNIAHAAADEWTKGKAPIYLDTTTLLYKYFFPTFIERISPHNTWQRLNYDRLREIGQAQTLRPQSQIVLYYGLQGCIRTNNDLMSDEIEGLFVCSLSQSFDMCSFKGVSSARGMWSGEKTGMNAPRYIREASAPSLDRAQLEAVLERSTMHTKRRKGQTYWQLMKKFQDIMFKPQIALRKTEESLHKGLDKLLAFREDELPQLYADNPHDIVKAHEIENMAQIAELYFKASMLRTESRYSHRHMEFPVLDNRDWLKFINWQKGLDGKSRMSYEAVPNVGS